MEEENKSGKILLDRIRDSFPSMYITLISIIQSSLLGYFASYFFRDDFDGFTTGEGWRLVSSLIIAVLVWNEYRMGSTVFRWVPNLIDTAIPFLLAFSQFFLLYSIKNPANWFFALCILYLVAMMAYKNMYYKVDKEIAKNKKDHDEIVNQIVMDAIGNFKRFNIYLCGVASFTCWYFYLFSKRISSVENPDNNFTLSFTVFCFFFNSCFLYRGNYYWQKIIAKTRNV